MYNRIADVMDQKHGNRMHDVMEDEHGDRMTDVMEDEHANRTSDVMVLKVLVVKREVCIFFFYFFYFLEFILRYIIKMEWNLMDSMHMNIHRHSM